MFSALLFYGGTLAQRSSSCHDLFCYETAFHVLHCTKEWQGVLIDMAELTHHFVAGSASAFLPATKWLLSACRPEHRNVSDSGRVSILINGSIHAVVALLPAYPQRKSA